MGIFCLLMFGIVGLQVPDETLLTFTGVLVHKGTLSPPLAFAAALGGSGGGTEAHVNRAHDWFRRRGRWGLTIGYFVPGVRHFTAYAAGMSALEPPQFALFAYSGAVLWVSTFLGLGYCLGERWEAVLRIIHRYAVEATVAGAIVAAAFLAVRWWWKRRARA